MEERKSFLFYRSFWSGGSKLKPRERLAFYDALALYAFTGQETSLPHNAAICWEFAKPLIDSNNKKYEDGSKGGRPQKTTGFDDGITTGFDSIKNISEDKEKEKEKREGKGERRTRQARKGTSPAEPVFQSLPGSLERLGYAATEDLKKRRLKELEQAAQHTTARPPDDDAETRRLKQQFMQQLNPVPVAAPDTPPADTGTAAASTQTPAHGADQSAPPTLETVQAPQPSGDSAHDQADTGPAGQEITAQPAPQHPPEESPAASAAPDRCQFGT